MAKRIQTPEELELYRDTMKLVKIANQRLARLEKATGQKESFAAKELSDYLSSAPIKGLTKSGRITTRKDLTVGQLKSIKKVTEDFLSPDSVSTVRKARQYTKKASKQLGKPLTLAEGSTIFEMRKNYDWIYDYFPGSTFWGEYGNRAIKHEIDENTFVNEIYQKIQGMEEEGSIVDEELRDRLINLYYYCSEES